MALSRSGVGDSRPSQEVLVAADVVRGVGRLLALQGFASIAEMPLPNGRRTDLTAIGRNGEIVIIEIKVSRADLLGDRKWTDYLDYCDRFFWALPPSLSIEPLSGPEFQPERSGIIRADRYGAAIIREAAIQPVAPARRKAELLRFARLAALRLHQGNDPDLANIVAESGW